MADINDVFNDIFMSEEKFVRLGYEEGVKAGENDAESYRNGVNTGVLKALEITKELGYYWGFSVVWSNHLIPKALEHMKEIALLTALRKGVEEAVLMMKESDVHNRLLKLRAKHRQACGMLRVENTMVARKEEKMDF